MQLISQKRKSRAFHPLFRVFRRSAINSIGIAASRVMGLAYSFILARAFSQGEYGYATYVITLGSVVAILTQPFGQHILPYLIGKYEDDETQRQVLIQNTWTILLGLIGLTVLIATPVLLVLGRFSLELMSVFIGITFFYAYQGLAGGFRSSNRFVAIYVLSNLVQLVLVVLLVFVFQIKNVALPVYVYGLSYFPPLVGLLLFFPLPVSFRLRFDWIHIRMILLKFVPLLISHILYIIYYVSDVLLLEALTDKATVGIYSLTKTLVSIFYIIPNAVSITLLSQMSNPNANRRKLLLGTLGLSTGANLLGAVFFMLLYEPVLRGFFDPDYYIGLAFGFLMMAGAILVPIHGMLFSLFVGTDKTYIDTVSRVAMVVTIFVAGILLIPDLHAIGAAWTILLAGLAGIGIQTSYLTRNYLKQRKPA